MPTDTPRLIFMGTPEFAAAALAALIAADRAPVAVYTQPMRPAGRGQKATASPVHALAERHGLPVHTPLNFKTADARAAFAAHAADLAIVAAYGLILPQAVLDAPRRGCVNLHASLLPRWRGAAPIQRAILAGDRETGICLMRMEAGLDTGPVHARAAVPITDTTTGGELHDNLAALAARLLIAHLPGLLDGTLPADPQPADGVTYAAKLGAADRRLDFSQSAVALDRVVRAFAPRPGAQAEFGGEMFKILAATPLAGDAAAPPGTLLDAYPTVACGSGRLRLERLQRPGRGPLDAAAFRAGFNWMTEDAKNFT